MRRARFGARRGSTPLWCSTHRKGRPEKLVDIYAPKCLVPECDKEPSWGRRQGGPGGDGRPKREYCAAHAKAFKEVAPDGTRMVHYQWCGVDGCRTVAKFGDPQERRRIRCAGHALEGHVNLALRSTS